MLLLGAQIPVLLGNENRKSLAAWEQQDIVSDQWRQVSLEVQKDNGAIIDVQLLRPLDWILENDVMVGNTVHVVLNSIGVDGPGEVKAVMPCPQIEQGEGNVVTGKFVHSSPGVLEIRVEGIEKPIGVTGAHRFYSVDRGKFIPARELVTGERLQLLGETARIAEISEQIKNVAVYNLEIAGVHVFRVGNSGILVHNDCFDRAMKIQKKIGGEIIVIEPNPSHGHKVLPPLPGSKGAGDIGGYDRPTSPDIHALHIKDGIIRDTHNPGGISADDYMDQLGIDAPWVIWRPWAPGLPTKPGLKPRGRWRK